MRLKDAIHDRKSDGHHNIFIHAAASLGDHLLSVHARKRPRRIFRRVGGKSRTAAPGLSLLWAHPSAGFKKKMVGDDGVARVHGAEKNGMGENGRQKREGTLGGLARRVGS